MSKIRKQTIISSLLIYVGFAFGALNTYLFIKNGIFTPEQYGLTRAIIVVGQFFYGFAGFGLTSVISKFYPYYKDNLPKEKNDLLTLCLLTALAGFLLTASGGILFQTVVVKKFIAKSPLFLRYYYWVFPFAFFLLFFSILEAYAWNVGKTSVPNFLKEAGFRIATTIIIVVFIFTGKNFDLFIKLFSLLYAVSFFALLFYLIYLQQLQLVFTISRLTKRMYKKMIYLMGYVYGGSLVGIGAQSIDSLAIFSYRGLNYGAVFDFSSYLANVIQVPQRSLISTAIPVLSRAWKQKDLATIRRIYERSSLNLLLVSIFIFCLIWLNFDNALAVLHPDPIYEKGKWVVFIIAMKNMVDMGTGVNGQIIGTSTYWRFDFFTGVILLLLIVPLNLLLIKEYGIIGSAISNLIAYVIYNIIRIIFLQRKFSMQPFTIHTIWVLLHGVLCFLLTYYLFRNLTGWTGLIVRTPLFVLVYGATAIYYKLSPDIMPVWATIRRRLRL